jgi:ABC-2 type transport system ATP-binding protein
VELRRDMWEVSAGCKADGVTIILTTHYIEEAEAMADRVGVINKGELLLVEEKTSLMARIGARRASGRTARPLDAAARMPRGARPGARRGRPQLVYTYDTNAERTGITRLLAEIQSKPG